jgi:hypothetical protein
MAVPDEIAVFRTSRKNVQVQDNLGRKKEHVRCSSDDRLKLSTMKFNVLRVCNG